MYSLSQFKKRISDSTSKIWVWMKIKINDRPVFKQQKQAVKRLKTECFTGFGLILKDFNFCMWNKESLNSNGSSTETTLPT